MNCDCCFSDFIAKCETELILYTLLTPDLQYKWVITDKFENKYEGIATSDENGYLIIPVEELPAGLLTQYSGSFKIEILELYTCSPIKFKIAKEYDCISFDISGGNYEKNYVGCPIE
jgi:hypothetical protein